MCFTNIKNSKFSWGACPQIPLEGHALHASVLRTLITIFESLPGLMPDQLLRASTSPENTLLSLSPTHIELLF